MGYACPPCNHLGFKEIAEGKHDDSPEQAFMYVGTIDEAVERAEKIQSQVD